MRLWRRREREQDLERELRSDLESEAAEHQEKVLPLRSDTEGFPELAGAESGLRQDRGL